MLYTANRFPRTVKSLLERTILHGEGNSLLIIGPRGSGKSWVSSTAMQSRLKLVPPLLNLGGRWGDEGLGMGDRLSYAGVGQVLA